VRIARKHTARLKQKIYPTWSVLDEGDPVLSSFKCWFQQTALLEADHNGNVISILS